MLKTAAAPALEVAFAEFLDSWKARWRYEPRWPTEECGTCGSPQFRVWLPMLHPARKRLGRAFFVQVGSQGGGCGYAERDLPLFRVCFEESETGEGTEFLFCDAEGRVCLRASWRAD
ncbi:MAG: hypothetical protein ACYTGZ_06135 [Planctomycetota bacterium]|jgi:hypothetical protein